MNCKSMSVLVFTLLLSACNASQDSMFRPAEEEESTGTIESEISTSGVRPLLVVMMRKQGTAALAHDRAYYQNRLFGPFPSVASYFSAASKGTFTVRLAGFVEVEDTDPAALDAVLGTTGLKGGERQRARALRRAIDSGFDFRPFDTNGSNSITVSELTLLDIDNEGDVFGGQTGGRGDCQTGSGMSICIARSGVGDQAGLMTIAHELTHTLGPGDLYGTNCLSSAETLMSCTILDFEDNLRYLLDPFHRKRLNWVIRDQSVPASGSGSARLAPLGTIGSSLPSTTFEQIQLKRSTGDESVFLEYRKADSGFDSDVAVDGVILWYVKSSDGVSLGSLTSLTNASKNDPADFTLAPNRCVGDPNDAASRGRTTTAAQPGYAYRFKWADGSDSGLRIVVDPVASDGTVLVHWDTRSEAGSCPEATPFPASCADAARDATVNINQSSISPDATYTHAECPHTYITFGRNIPAGATGYAAYAGPVTTPAFLGCGAMWVQASLWQRVGSVNVHVADGPIQYGVPFGSGCLPPTSAIAVPTTGNYEIIGVAGAITTYQAVSDAFVQ